MAEATFDGILKERAPELHKRLEDMHARAQEDWVHLLKPDHGSHSGLVHLRNVERNADKMIPDKQKRQFSDGEIFLLLASILLHDLGRIIPDQPRREVVVRWLESDGVTGRPEPPPVAGTLLWNRVQWQKPEVEEVLFNSGLARLSERILLDWQKPEKAWTNRLVYRLVSDTPQCCPLKKDKDGNYLSCTDQNRYLGEQKTHACRTKFLIDKYWANFGLPDKQLATLCGVITFCHQLDTSPDAPEAAETQCFGICDCAREFGETSVEPYGRIRVGLLAAILRLADETEDSWTRAIRQHWYEQFLRVEGSGDLYKAFRRGITDVEFLAEARCIIMHMHLEPPITGQQSEGGALEDERRTNTLLKSLRKKVDATRGALSGWRKSLEPAGVDYTQVYIQQKGRLHVYPGFDPPPLADVLGATVRDPARDPAEEPIQGALAEKHTIDRYLRRIERMVLGTAGYEDYHWSSIEGAVGQNLDGQGKWIIERMGKVHGGLRIVPHHDGVRVKITFDLAQRDAIYLAVVGSKAERTYA